MLKQLLIGRDTLKRHILLNDVSSRIQLTGNFSEGHPPFGQHRIAAKSVTSRVTNDGLTRVVTDKVSSCLVARLRWANE